MDEHEKKEIKEIIERSVDHKVLDTILSELSEEDKKIFLSNMVDEDHEKIWNHLNQRIERIEDKIKEASEYLKKEIAKDISSVQAGG